MSNQQTTVLLSAFIQHVSAQLSLPIDVIDSSINTMQTIPQCLKAELPPAHLAIACIHLNSKSFEKDVNINTLIKLAYSAVGKNLCNIDNCLVSEIINLESLIMTYTSTYGFNPRSCRTDLRMFSKKYDLSDDIVNKILRIWKGVLYTSDVLLTFSNKDVLALCVFIFLNMNHLTLESLDSRPWYQHISQDISELKLEKMFHIFNEKCKDISYETKEKIFRFINRSMGQSLV